MTGSEWEYGIFIMLRNSRLFCDERENISKCVEKVRFSKGGSGGIRVAM